MLLYFQFISNLFSIYFRFGSSSSFLISAGLFQFQLLVQSAFPLLSTKAQVHGQMSLRLQHDLSSFFPSQHNRSSLSSRTLSANDQKKLDTFLLASVVAHSKPSALTSPKPRVHSRHTSLSSTSSTSSSSSPTSYTLKPLPSIADMTPTCNDSPGIVHKFPRPLSELNRNRSAGSSASARPRRQSTDNKSTPTAHGSSSKATGSSSSTASAHLDPPKSHTPGHLRKMQQKLSTHKTQHYQCMAADHPPLSLSHCLERKEPAASTTNSPPVIVLPQARKQSTDILRNLVHDSSARSTAHQPLHSVDLTLHHCKESHTSPARSPPISQKPSLTLITPATNLQQPSLTGSAMPELPTFSHAKTATTNYFQLPSNVLADLETPPLGNLDQTTRSKQATKLATLLLNVKLASETVPSNLHSTPSSPSHHKPAFQAERPLASGSMLESQILENFGRPVNPSVETLMRAQKARANLEIHFSLIALFQDPCLTLADGSLRNKDCPVAPSYNPLQSIRNRRIRPAQGPLELHPTGQKNFGHYVTRDSKNEAASLNTHHWTLDASELMSDHSWQYVNYHLMRGPDSKLLFPDVNHKHQTHSSLKPHVPPNRVSSTRSRNNSLHSSSKLASRFNKLKKTISGTPNRPNSAPVPPSPQPYQLVETNPVPDLGITAAPTTPAEELENPLIASRESSGRLDDNYQPVIVDIPIESAHKTIQRAESVDPPASPEPVAFVPKSNSSNDGSTKGRRSKPNSVSLNAPAVIVSDEKSAAVAVVVAPFENSSSSNSMTSQKGATTGTVTAAAAGLAPASNEAASTNDASEDALAGPAAGAAQQGPGVDVQQLETASGTAELQYFELLLYVTHFSSANNQKPGASTTSYYRRDYPMASSREREAKLISREFNSAVRSVQKDLVPHVQSNVSQSQTRLDTLRRTQLSKTSTRIDSLLVDSDQTINRLSTTLSLEIKQLSERLDVLERIKMPLQWRWFIVNTGYRVLEYFVICLMWLVWGLVSVLMGAKSIFDCFFYVFKWFLWC